MKISKFEQNNYLIHQTASSAWVDYPYALTAIKFFAYDYTGGGSHGNVTGNKIIWTKRIIK